MLWDSFKQGFNINRACIRLALSIVAPPVFSSLGKTEDFFPRLKTPLKKNSYRKGNCFQCWHRSIFPGGFPPSIFDTDELNYRVRDGNGWTLIVIDTNYGASFARHSFISSQAFAHK